MSEIIKPGAKLRRSLWMRNYRRFLRLHGLREDKELYICGPQHDLLALLAAVRTYTEITCNNVRAKRRRSHNL